LLATAMSLANIFPRTICCGSYNSCNTSTTQFCTHSIPSNGGRGCGNGNDDTEDGSGHISIVSVVLEVLLEVVNDDDDDDVDDDDDNNVMVDKNGTVRRR
jgi:hypothetical protein